MAFIKVEMERRRVLSSVSAGGIPSYWWARGRNFGDLMTPYLVEKITGRSAINAWEVDLGQVDVLCSTGSVLHTLRAGNYTVWGSGFIKPVPSSSAHTKLCALRGPLSGEVAEKIGWKNPKKYGDPALLLPLFLPPNEAAPDIPRFGNVVVIPHYALLNSTSATRPGTSIVSPMQEIEDIVPSIANAGLVISSSLHGLILAQAYGRPWVWLRDHQNSLYGGDFKFLDFFASLNVSPPCLECGGEVTEQVVDKAAKMAMLAPREVMEARQRDLLDCVPDVLDTPVISQIRATMAARTASPVVETLDSAASI